MTESISLPPLRLGVIYDFRLPPGSDFTTPELYAEVLDQVALVEQLGYDQVWLTEHHFVEDGYLPSFTTVAGAVAARTSRVRISTDVALLPFHHAVRLAEDMAVLDNISAGRMELGIGMGYALHEFQAFGIPRSRRVSLTEEGIEVLRGAWGAEPFSFHGKRYDLTDLDVHPKPVQPGGPPLFLAATSTAGALRAVRMGTHLLPQGSRAEVLDPWQEATRTAGVDLASKRVGINRGILVTDDPGRDWQLVRQGEIYRAKMYRKWNQESGDNTTAWEAEDKIPQTWVVGTADEVLEELTDFVLEFGITDLASWVSPPGVRPSWRNESLEAFARDVAPRLRERVAQARGVGAGAV